MKLGVVEIFKGRIQVRVTDERVGVVRRWRPRVDRVAGDVNAPRRRGVQRNEDAR